MDYSQHIEQAYTEVGRAGCPGGDFPCSYTEEYAESLNVQGVDRAVSVPRHIARARGLEIGTVIDWIHPRGAARIEGPFTIETSEPLGTFVVRLRLRDGANG